MVDPNLEALQWLRVCSWETPPEWQSKDLQKLLLHKSNENISKHD